MARGANGSDEVAMLLRRYADEERRLLKRERRAELEVVEQGDRLLEEQARLDRALARVERCRAEIAVAVATLRQRQEARAAGPAFPEGDATASTVVEIALGDAAARDRTSPAASNDTPQGEGVATS